MGKKHRKAKKKWKNSSKGKKSKKNIDLLFQSRRDYVLSVFDKHTLDLWFHGNKNEINEFADFLIDQEEISNAINDLDILGDDNYYDKEINRLRNKEVDSVDDAFENLYKIKKLEKKKSKRNNKFKGDKGISIYLNGKGKSKKFLNKNKYSKEIKKIAKAEQREINEMKKLGLIKKSPSIDDELKRLKNANRLMNKAVKEIYHDAYSQKYFIDE